ncbi:MAG TPA: TonB-dependent receptor, partial [Flavobacteriaceae bacterium]|nr:TonB-dependent receptor [Flavobacteriaceae bacterium]
HDVEQKSIYSNLVYNSIINDTRHKIKTGASFSYDNYDEFVNNMRIQNFDLDRKEHSYGVFFEYSYDNMDKVNLSTGIRYDKHNIIGGFITPRMHLNYLIFPKTSLKISAGKGTRMANIFSENHKLFYSSRIIFFGNSPLFDNVWNQSNYFDLKPESAWNYGASLINSFRLFDNNAQLILDYYFTDFENQVVVDWETPSAILFYNLEGKSFARSFQAQLSYELTSNINILSAYKISDVKTDYLSGRLYKPLNPKNRFFLNFAYQSNKRSNGANWKYDFTYNWIGEQRFPSTQNNPVEYRMNEFTPDINLINTQLTRVFNKSFEAYLGIENATNYKQMNPIIANDDPFGQYFDSTFVYGPIFGRMYYLGLRYRIN